jgi:hypothetical protein
VIAGLFALGTILSAASLSATPSAPSKIDAAPILIIFGGGWGAEGTQASIEAHVDQLSRALASRKPVILFAAGDPRIRSVQIPSKDRDETADILGLIFDRRDNIDVAYRAPETGFDQPASKSSLYSALDRTKSTVVGTIVFGVGHGSAESDDERSALELWGPDDRVTVDELARHLDKESRHGPTAFVLGHCHSGAFIDMTYQSGDTKGRLAQPARCIFAAVPREREAAGCTADAGDPSAKAYMALIAEAFQKPHDADFDKNGHVSIAEAHAYARIHDDTVDTPVSSSESFLKKVLGAKSVRAETAHLQKIAERARPAEKAVLSTLNPFPDDTGALKTATRAYDDLNKRAEHVEDEIEALQRKFDRLRRVIVDRVLTQFPELANPYHKESRRLLAGDAPQVMAMLRKMPDVHELAQVDSAIADKDDELLEIDHRRALIERWLNAVEYVANEEALHRSGSKKDIESFERLVACESLEPL